MFGSLSVLMWMPWGRLGLLIGTITINLLALTLPLVILQTYDRIIPNQSTNSLFLLVVGVCGALLLDAILRIARADLVGRAGARFVHFMKCEAVNRLLNGRMQDIDRDEPGVHLERLTALDTLRDHHTGQVLITFVDLPFALIFLSLITYIAGWLVVVPLSLFIAFAILALVLGYKLRAKIEERSQGEDRRHSFIVEVLTGIHTVKALGMEALINRRYERLLDGNTLISYDVLRMSARAQELGAVVSQITIVAVAVAGSFIVMAGDLTVGGLVACTLLAGRALQPLLKGLNFWTQLQNVNVAARQTSLMFALRDESEGGKETFPARLEGKLDVEGLSYRYDRDEAMIVHNVDLHINPGEIVGITGENGSGKSTFLALLGGMLTPTSGQVLYDGHDGANVAKRAIRGQVAYVPQTAVLFDGTLLENLTGFRTGEVTDRALEISAQLGLDRRVALLPGGYQSRLGDGSAETLPPGMRQQIAIVRALSVEPSIILFDEANANLDSGDDARLAKLLKSKRGRTTVLLVSHRPTTLMVTDRNYQLANGKLIEHERLPYGPYKPGQLGSSLPERGKL
jgi:ATP-binding cassette subfamily C protein LapB